MVEKQMIHAHVFRLHRAVRHVLAALGTYYAPEADPEWVLVEPSAAGAYRFHVQLDTNGHKAVRLTIFEPSILKGMEPERAALLEVRRIEVAHAQGWTVIQPADVTLAELHGFAFFPLVEVCGFVQVVRTGPVASVELITLENALKPTPEDTMVTWIRPFDTFDDFIRTANLGREQLKITQAVIAYELLDAQFTS